MKNRESIELMAPVGSYESLMAAIQGGANSVYFGVEQLNMRARSSQNFTLSDLQNIAQISSENGLKTYLSVNTVIYGHELDTMMRIIDAAKESGISAIIATDQAAIHYARYIDLDVHLSTQLNISNIESLKFYSNFASVVVLARELTLDQMAEIAKQIELQQVKGITGELIKIEIFVHGALCMAISGKCYLSLHEQDESANRGKCMQTCRKAYIVTEKESSNQLEIDHEYIMSPKDLCTIGFVDRIIESGVSVFKIEGRARPPEYVKQVTQCYDEAIKAYFDGTYTPEKITLWEDRLKTTFNRGFWGGYYLGGRLGEWSGVYGSKATKRKIYVGKGTNYFSNLQVGEFLLEAGELSVGDEILITGPTTGVITTTVTEMRLDTGIIEHAKQGDVISIPVADKVRRSDKLYKIVAR